MDKGILIVVEGIDGAGKTTQVHLLGEALRDAGETVVLSKEPTDGRWGRLVRESARTGRLGLDEELQAFIEDRREHIASVVKPSLERGEVVILDRYFYSTIAYQGARGADVQSLTQQMNELAPSPDIVLLIDADPAVTLSRISAFRGEIPNHFERQDSLGAVRDIFRRLSSDDSRINVIDGHLPVATVYDNIMSLLLKGVLKAKRCFKSYGCDELYCSARLAGQCRWAELHSALTSRRPMSTLIPNR